MKLGGFVLFGGVMLALGAASVFAAPLITAREARLPDAAGALNTRGISRGPAIKVISPEPASQNKGPFDFRVEFSPRGGAKIDTSSVKVIYLKSPAVDLTSRVIGSVTEGGIDFKNAEIPPGDHQIKISVQDSDGRETSALTTLVGAK